MFYEAFKFSSVFSLRRTGLFLGSWFYLPGALSYFKILDLLDEHILFGHQALPLIL